MRIQSIEITNYKAFYGTHKIYWTVHENVRANMRVMKGRYCI